VIYMDFIPWFYGPSLYVPFIASTILDGKPLPTELDVELIELIYLVIANEHECSECGHVLGRGLRVRNASDGAPSRWPVWVDTKCCGWRRHPHVAEVTRPSEDLILGPLRLRRRLT
jgi:hypothetical protein